MAGICNVNIECNESSAGENCITEDLSPNNGGSVDKTPNICSPNKQSGSWKYRLCNNSGASSVTISPRKNKARKKGRSRQLSVDANSELHNPSVHSYFDVVPSDKHLNVDAEVSIKVLQEQEVLSDTTSLQKNGNLLKADDLGQLNSNKLRMCDNNMSNNKTTAGHNS